MPIRLRAKHPAWHALQYMQPCKAAQRVQWALKPRMDMCPCTCTLVLDCALNL